MSLAQILALVSCALLIGWLAPRHLRIWLMLVASLLTVFWLQPSLPIRNLDFWLPCLSIALTVLVWASTLPPEQESRRFPLAGILLIVLPILLVSLTRYLDPLCCLTPSRPPDLVRIGLGLGLAAGIIAVPYLLPGQRRLFSWLSLFLLLAIFIILKSPALTVRLSTALRLGSGQSIALADPSDVVWLGFSFLAFRLIHVLRDFQAGRLPAYTMEKLVTYAIFYPSYLAGPIDRSQRWIGELDQIKARPPTDISERDLKASDTVAGLQRILFGMFKKFVLADSLALIALSPQNAAQTASPFWMWVLLLSYTFRIYFDFSGYTDIAIGLGRLMGFHLPENFNRPYLKQNITLFWNSWHMTLAQWFRTYVFNPLTRNLRTRPHQLPAWLIIFFGQVSTMALIGLWHGITWNFLIWGLWHGLGLFVHNSWTDWSRQRIDPQAGPQTGPQIESFLGQSVIHSASAFGGWLATFVFVSLGWVWFATPDPALAVLVFRKLIGL